MALVRKVKRKVSNNECIFNEACLYGNHYSAHGDACIYLDVKLVLLTQCYIYCTLNVVHIFIFDILCFSISEIQHILPQNTQSWKHNPTKYYLQASCFSNMSESNEREYLSVSKV